MPIHAARSRAGSDAAWGAPGAKVNRPWPHGSDSICEAPGLAQVMLPSTAAILTELHRQRFEERGDAEPLCQRKLSKPAVIRKQKEPPMTAPKKPQKSATSNKPQRDPLPGVHIPRPGEPNQDQDEIEELERERIDERTDEREIIRQTAKPRSSRQSLKGPNNRKQSTSRR